MGRVWDTLLFIACVASVSRAFQWESSLILPDNSTMVKCPGQDVGMVWNFTLLPEEHLVNIEWYRTPETAIAPEMLATEVNGHVFMEPTTFQHIDVLPSAGVRLKNVSKADTASYMIRVKVDKHGSEVTYQQSVNLLITDKPIAEDDRLHAQQAGVRFVNSTHDHHLLLSCGKINPEWDSSIDVLWQTPDKQTVPSSDWQDGHYFLVLPNPVVAGEYRCTIDSSSPGAQCAQMDSPVWQGASVLVDGVQGRLALLESQLRAKDQQIQSLTDELQRLRNNTTDVQNVVHFQGMEIGNQQMTLQTLALANYNLTHNLLAATRPVSFHALETTGGPLNLSSSILQFSNVKHNLGGAFDSRTGVFTAPVAGTYSFHLSIVAARHSLTGAATSANIMVDNEKWCRAVSSDVIHGTYAQGGCHVVAHLQPRQKVHAESVARDSLYVEGTAFSGVLVQADLPRN